nr:MAG TPA: Dynamin family [Bacteriophage sp.]DAU12685.1 MAG TPA: Dynamin family [Caudoviricetes sp.]DAZ59118.1 MAG TPA: Dynamin family [Caudoviricetes sp.]
MAGGKSTLLHHIFQRQGLLPSEVMSLPSGERAFLFASTRLWIEANTKKG